MKVILSCWKCTKYGHTGLSVRELEFDDNLYSKYVCENGHTISLIVDRQKFEHLFDIGIMAYIDGYKRESVATIASALERFYEFYIQIILEKHSIKYDEFIKAWSDIKNQSERQYGAFLFLYLLEKGTKAPSIDKKIANISGVSRGKTKTWTAFRNAVIHKGYIPKKEESYAYIELVYNYIHNLLIDIFENYSSEKSKVILNNRIAFSEEDKKHQHSYLDAERVIDLNGFDKNHTFEDKFKRAEEIMDSIKKAEISWAR